MAAPTSPEKLARVVGSKGSPEAPMIFVDSEFAPGAQLKVYQQGATADAQELEIGVIEVVEFIEGNSVCRLVSGSLPAPGDVVRP